MSVQHMHVERNLLLIERSTPRADIDIMNYISCVISMSLMDFRQMIALMSEGHMYMQLIELASQFIC